MSGVRIAFPSLGLLSLVAEQFLRALGMDVITPPPLSRRTLDIGVQESADGLCIPCKLLHGNYVEAAERGANEIIMLGGPGTCRLGYSARQQVEQLARRGLAVRAFREQLEKDVVVLARHQVMGALGVALLARDWQGDQRTEFRGFEIAGADYRATSFECGACPNLCETAQIQLDGKVVARWGGRCDRWAGG